MTIESTEYRTLAPPGFRGQEDFFPACSEAGLLMPRKTKPFTGPLQNGLVHSPGRINGNTCRSFLSLERNLLFLSEYAESSGVPIEVSRKGKAPPLERGRGKVFPACEPDRVTAEGILSEEMIGFAPQNSSLEEKQWAHQRRLTFLRKVRGY